MDFRDIVKTKEFPTMYAEDVVKVIEAMSISGKPQIVGSMSFRSQQYAGDYDMIEKIEGNFETDEAAVRAFVSSFQSMVLRLMQMKGVFVGDIKCGEVQEWKILSDDVKIQNGKVIGWDSEKSKAKALSMHRLNIITKDELDKILPMMKPTLTPMEFLLLKKEIKFAVVRWTPQDVLNGFVNLRANRRFTLYEGITTPALTKVDVISYVENSRFTDFSLIYLFYNKGKALNPMFGRKTAEEEKAIYVNALRSDILYYRTKGNTFKALKRVFALARALNKKEILKTLTELMNSDLGRLYSITSDVGTILNMIKNVEQLPEEKIKYEIDMFRKRLSNIYTVNNYDFSKDDVFELIFKSENPLRTAVGRGIVYKNMEKMEEIIDAVLKDETDKAVRKIGVSKLFPKWTVV